MKITTCTALWITALAFAPAFGQEAPTPSTSPQPPRPLRAPGPTVAPAPAPIPPGAPPGTFTERLQNIINRAGQPEPEPQLTRFSLDFPGGTPEELVAAIEKAMKRPLNVIIPEELAATKLPALKMSGVTVPQLFQALTAASHKTEAVVTSTSYGGGAYGGYQSYQNVPTGFGFRQGSEGKVTDDTIWYFYVEKPTLPPVVSSAKVCHFYSLAPYLDRGYTVDDITTAIETGWKMMGDTTTPEISFHKDTKLLIAVGQPSKLETIDAVLKALLNPVQALPPGFAVPPKLPAPPSAPAKPAAEPKSEK
jgi:hypothetical protein